jgi:hypothetical protein
MTSSQSDWKLTQRLAPFPETAIVEVSPTVAGELLEAAHRLPLYDNRDFYSAALQESVHDDIRDACWDGFNSLVDMARERIAQWPYCILIKGLYFDGGNRLFVAINRAFGELVALPYRKPRAQLVHYIQPGTDIISPRGGHESERLHTDASDWETPVELISMVCVRADPLGGGRSRVLDIDTIRAEVQKQLGTEALEILETEAVPWQLNAACGGGLRWGTVLTKSGMCWRRYSIDLALHSEQANLSEHMKTLLGAFEEVLESTPCTFDFLMREGELLVSDNRRTVHARTPIAANDVSDRLMIRSWIRTV